MAEFHVGDRVRFIGVFSWMKGFLITEIHPDGVHFSGEGRAWWHEDVLDHEVTPQEVDWSRHAVALERAFHEFNVAKKNLDRELDHAQANMPMAVIEEIKRAAAA